MSNSPNEPEYPPGVTRILDTKHGVGRAVVAELSENDVSILRELVAGDLPATNGDRTKAMAALVERGDSEVAGLLVEVATDGTEHADLRAMATANLSALPAAAAEPALVELLNVESEGVVAAAAHGLGEIGREEAFEALSRLAEDLEGVDAGTVGRPSTFPDAVTREVALAHTLVAYRLGNAEPTLPEIEGIDRSRLPARDDAVRIPVEPVGDIDGIVAKTAGSLYGIEPYPEWGVRFGAEQAPLAPTVLLLNNEYATGAVTELAEHPGIYGLLLSGQRETGRYAVSSVLLVTPGDGTLRVDQLRTDGTTLFTGTSQPAEAGIQVTLTDTGHAGTPALRYVIRRTEEDPRLAFEEAVVSTTTTSSRNPEPFER